MNKNTLRALLADARYQVFDNVVFRILIGVAALFVALSYCISFGEKEVSLFFGTWTFGYAEVAPFPSPDPRTTSIQFLQSLIIDLFAGMFGIMLAIAATAFFTPKMLEKGAADNVFSKPVGRFTLLLSRYFAGVLFVTLLSFLMVFGIQSGLSIASGYNDMGFLWSALTLVYVYAALQSFSILVATVMRSSVAAILLTMMLFMFTGCANAVWITFEFNVMRSEEPSRDSMETYEPKEQPVIELVHDALTWFRAVLPRTGDADIIARKLRRQIEGDDDEIAIFDGVDEAFFLNDQHPALTFRGGGLAALDGDGLVWDIEGGGSLTVTRRDRDVRVMAGGRERAVTSREYARTAREELEARLGQDALIGKQTDRVDWTEPGDTPHPRRARAFLARGDHVFEVAVETTDAALAAAPDVNEPDEPVGFGPDVVIRSDTPSSTPPDLVDWMLQQNGFGKDPSIHNQGLWYERRFGWTSPWQYNAFVSIGTTIAFALAMLLLARWRLSRIDF